MPSRYDPAPSPRTLALALHDIEPATFERCVQIRDWLAGRGVDRMTLLVIPARDLHPLAERSPELAQWLAERARAGDSIAQHGFQHAGGGAPATARSRVQRACGAQPTEFSHLDADDTRRAVEAGWRVLKLAGVEPHGFVAPGYAYTPALRESVSRRFEWWADLLEVRHAASADDAVSAPHPAKARTPAHAGRNMRLPIRAIAGIPLVPASRSRFRREASVALWRIQERLPQTAVRLDIHPHDFDGRSGAPALEWMLRSLDAGSQAVTYDEMALRPLPEKEAIQLKHRVNVRRRSPADPAPASR